MIRIFRNKKEDIQAIEHPIAPHNDEKKDILIMLDEILSDLDRIMDDQKNFYEKQAEMAFETR